jgi:hypothetical protein
MKPKMTRTILTLITALLLTTALVACGGGGSSASTPVTNGATLSGSAR